ncbi:MAG: HEAT repeat domain-containing protein [Smithella sp.]
MKVRDSISDDTKKLFAYLLLAAKNVSLYPKGHSISINSMRQFHETLETFIRQYGDVKIEFERDRVTCQGVEVHAGPSEEGTLPFTLFRDGIRWLEFVEGIELEEIREVLSLINRYSVLTTEPEGDIVTAFWESHFDHVLYKADDFVSGQAGDADDFFSEHTADKIDTLSKPDTMPRSTETITVTDDKPESPGGLAIDTAPSGAIILDRASFVLTPREQLELQEMVFREEGSSATEHLNMLLDMFLQHQEKKDFNIVLEVLLEEFEVTFARNDFDAALIILDGVRKILDSGRMREPWEKPLIESFYKDISSDSKCLKPLKNIWSSLNAQQMETIERILQHLSPESVETLMHLLLFGQPSQLEQITEDTIVSLINKDMSCLDDLIKNPDNRISEKLVHILSRLEGDKPLKYMMKLARHSSVSVRRLALRAIGKAHGDQISTIFEFIEDPDISVRRLILTQMSQSRNEITEDLLMQYLQSKKFGATQTEYIKECFLTLGKCGSLRSVPFLSKILLHRKWLAGFKKSAHREGAALALVALKIPEAQQIIETAGRSFHPGLRMIAHRAGKEFFQKYKGDQ